MLHYINRHIIQTALSLLPATHSDEGLVRQMLTAIGLQESGFKHRQQIGGPARGFWQFELIGVKGVLEHHTTAKAAAEVCERLQYEPSVSAVYQAIADNDVLAACFARLLLWQHPDPLPLGNDIDGAWDYYISQWRPGRPHRETWDDHFKASRWRY